MCFDSFSEPPRLFELMSQMVRCNAPQNYYKFNGGVFIITLTPIPPFFLQKIIKKGGGWVQEILIKRSLAFQLCQSFPKVGRYLHDQSDHKRLFDGRQAEADQAW